MMAPTAKVPRALLAGGLNVISVLACELLLATRFVLHLCDWPLQGSTKGPRGQSA